MTVEREAVVLVRGDPVVVDARFPEWVDVDDDIPEVRDGVAEGVRHVSPQLVGRLERRTTDRRHVHLSVQTVSYPSGAYVGNAPDPVHMTSLVCERNI